MFAKTGMRVVTPISRFTRGCMNPMPSPGAPRYIRETYVLARGRIPLSSPLFPLQHRSRMFGTFQGSPRDFEGLVARDPVLVFFYKTICAPCMQIRERMMTAADRATGAASAAISGGSWDSLTTADKGVSDTASPARVRSAGPPLDDELLEILQASLANDEEAQRVCQTLQEKMTVELGAAMGRVHFVTVNTDENYELTALHDVRSLPTFIAYKGGCILGRVEGAHDRELMRLLQKLSTSQDG